MKWPECGFRYSNPDERKPGGAHVFRVCERPWGHWLRKKWMPHRGREVHYRRVDAGRPRKGPESKWQ
jgi:hypothetical protein